MPSCVITASAVAPQAGLAINSVFPSISAPILHQSFVVGQGILTDSCKAHWPDRGRKVHGAQRALVCSQKMADLPKEHVTPGQPLFSHVGIDYFGPFMEKQGRSQVKRYGCIFTCLTIKAVHIEIGHSLETDSFINTLRQLIARRGKKCASAEEVEVTAYS